MKRNCLYIGSHFHKDFGCLVERRVPPLIDEIGFEKLILNMKSLYAKLPNKKVDRCALPRRLAYDSMMFKHRPPGRRGKEPGDAMVGSTI